jgi:hypothetical protein
VHGVRMREESESRPSAVPGNPRDEVGPIRDFGVELDLDPVLLEVLAQQLRGQGLVPGRVDRVEADQLPEEVGRLLTQRDGSQDYSSFLASSVSSLRASQSSG